MSNNELLSADAGGLMRTGYSPLPRGEGMTLQIDDFTQLEPEELAFLSLEGENSHVSCIAIMRYDSAEQGGDSRDPSLLTWVRKKPDTTLPTSDIPTRLLAFLDGVSKVIFLTHDDEGQEAWESEVKALLEAIIPPSGLLDGSDLVTEAGGSLTGWGEKFELTRERDSGRTVHFTTGGGVAGNMPVKGLLKVVHGEKLEGLPGIRPFEASTRMTRSMASDVKLLSQILLRQKEVEVEKIESEKQKSNRRKPRVKRGGRGR